MIKRSVLCLLGLPAVAAAQGFSAPVQLSQHGYAASPMVAIDATGTALAAWADEGAWYSVHSPGQAWTAPATMPILGGSGLTMQMNAAGTATVASYQSMYGIYTTDRPAGGSWSASTTVVSGIQIVTSSRVPAPGIILVGNPAGTQAIVWEQYSSGLQIMAVERPAGGAWGTPQLVVTPPPSLNIALAAAAIGTGGDLLVAWETSQTVCSTRYCNELNFIVHASRQAAGAASWSDSGPLTPGINTQGYTVRALIDGVGHSGLILQAGTLPTQLLALRQNAATLKWGPVVAAFTDTGGGYPTLAGAAAGPHAQASYASFDYGSPPRILWGDGKLGANTWSAPFVLSATDLSPPEIGLAEAANAADGAVVAWVDQDDTVRATLRRTATAPFAAAGTLAASDGCQMTVFIAPCRSPAVAAINGVGQAAVLYLQANLTDTNYTLFASTND